jgi:hypothetical protein
MSGTMIALLDLNEREAMDARVLQRNCESWKEGGMLDREVFWRRSRAGGVSWGFGGGEGGRTEGYGEGVVGVEDWSAFFVDCLAGLEDGC